MDEDYNMTHYVSRVIIKMPVVISGVSVGRTGENNSSGFKTQTSWRCDRSACSQPAWSVTYCLVLCRCCIYLVSLEQFL